jgi:tetratricopeptide (TPR) repeat protein
MFVQEGSRQAERQFGLRRWSFFIGASQPAWHRVAARLFSCTGLAFLRTAPALLLLAPALPAQNTASTPPETATLHGVVHDHGGKLVANAHVALAAKEDGASRETSTNAAGAFTFTGLSMGSYTVTATAGALRSPAISVVLAASGEPPIVDLVLAASGPEASASTPQDASQAMQFADKPDFAIAAVTDWTAAGGHGSDASLRTSEALTREAVKLEPGSTQPAAAGSPSGANEPKESESALRAAVEQDPASFAANHRLGLFCLQAGHYPDAIRSFQAAYHADPANYDNEFDLAQALKLAGDASQARDHVRQLLARRPSADLHRIEGELDETLGDSLSAVGEFQQAASEDPSEDNYFAWGSELLVHRAVWQAKEVFDEGARLYPHSARMLTARGAALFAGARYNEAALDLCQASDLNPQSAEPYIFMGKIESAAPDPLPCVLAKLKRFASLQPSNSLANYYYALALWKQEGNSLNAPTLETVQAMLVKAVTLDPQCADGFFELGNLSAGRRQWQQAIAYYLQAIQANPDLSEAHYRLGVAYQRTGDKAKATEQFQLHDAIAKAQAAEIQRQRKAVKQFVVTLPDQTNRQQAR